jgi:hypothetical protein
MTSSLTPESGAKALAKDLAQAMFSYDSASHTDPHLRDVAWSRENEVLALGTAVSLA